MGVDNLLYIKEIPWKGLGTQYDTQPDNCAELIDKAKLNWTVNALPLATDLHDHVFNYHAIYREDNNGLLGVVNKVPTLVQNSEMFTAFDYLLGESVDVDTASSFDAGKTVFGSFKIREQYKLLDDDIDHYFVVVNDHCKVDGKVSVLNTPVRIICQNTLELAMHKNIYHLRIPITADASINRSLSKNILSSVGDAIINAKKNAEEMFMKKTSPRFVEKVMDELFPFPKVEEDTVLHTRAMESVEILRDTFKEQCLDADNLDNYRGTQWQFLNAVIDFDQHFHTRPDTAYDLGYRMKRMAGVGSAALLRTAKFLKIKDAIAA